MTAGLEPGTVSVNLSVRQFRQEGLVRTVSRILEDTGLEPSRLEMELTESMVMHNVDASIAILQITMIVSFFNYINRMADALGVGRGSP